ncbi:MAG: hypothetical protein KY469_18305 [Actinobacteria bacterium]|nr:hypothetical protein [Actinomycetota bacterium]
MSRRLDVTPAGNALFRVDIVDPDPATTNETTIEVAVPDGFVDDLALDADASLQDVVLEAVRYVLDRTDDPDQIGPEVSLADLASQHPGLAESLRGRLSDRGDGGAPTHMQRVGSRRASDKDQRLVDEVRAEQAAGQASTPERRY